MEARNKARPRMDSSVGIDSIDKRILTHLNKDARKSFRKIGREIGVSSVTVGSRVRRLMDEGYITGFITAIDPKKFGKDISVIFGLNISPNMVETVTNRLKVLPQVTLMYSVSGNYNLMVHGLFKGQEELNTFLRKELFTIEGINNEHTFIILKEYKRCLGSEVVSDGDLDEGMVLAEGT
ncbi:MAG: Lrp/AsnC family transcriptional regulator [Candidatus Undinarchaeales archaeon]|jgi:Lrp/AsnC family transcriptional regulator for asnA, asnC and gidA|nr:Lrp/AsnC family transcriptional regulator [Candidatus Undinarchaeales archaeon]MDP7491924.1 Lrp/AsnC family transcriptional regulator [Candidatus Undinarchaeales archaeon]